MLIAACFILALTTSIPTFAVTTSESSIISDSTTKAIDKMLQTLAESGLPANERRAKAAQMLVASKLDTSVATDTTWNLSPSLEAFTPIGFINAIQALALASESSNPGWRDFVRELTRLSYRKGEEGNFGTILWHGADWIADNVYRGNLKEMTDNYEGTLTRQKSLDYFSTHPEDFAAMSNPEIADRIEMNELGYKQHSLPYLKRQYITRRDIVDDMKNGDIIIMLASAEGVDIYRIGYVITIDNVNYMCGINPAKGMVTLDSEPLERIFKRDAKHFFGFRWLRWSN